MTIVTINGKRVLITNRTTMQLSECVERLSARIEELAQQAEDLQEMHDAAACTLSGVRARLTSHVNGDDGIVGAISRKWHLLKFRVHDIGKEIAWQCAKFAHTYGIINCLCHTTEWRRVMRTSNGGKDASCVISTCRICGNEREDDFS